jgi:RHS repeat-associated protein
VKFKLKISGTIEQASVVYRCVLLFFIFATCSQASIPNFTQADIAYSGDHRVEVYTHGPDLSGTLGGAGGIGGILADFRPQTSDLRFFHADAMGNVVMTTDSSGEIISTHRYTPFGRPITSTGSYQPRFGFSSKEYDHETGLNYYGYRYLAVSQGRWLNRDPIQEDGGINLYGFIFNRPMSGVDYLGREFLGYNRFGDYWDDVIENAQGQLRGAKLAAQDLQQTPANIREMYRFIASGEAAQFFDRLLNDPCFVALLRDELGHELDSLLGQLQTNSGQGELTGRTLAGLLSGGIGVKIIKLSRNISRVTRNAPKNTPITNPSRLLPERAGPIAHISPNEVIGRTPAQINARTQQLGLQPRGPDPAMGRGAYIDPQTGVQRILSHPNATPPHGHVNNPAGLRIGPDGSVVPPNSPGAHLPINYL